MIILSKTRALYSLTEAGANAGARGTVAGLLTALLVCGALTSHAGDPEGVRPASLDVKSRIKSMEQVNVTAEKQIDESAPPPSAVVAELLAELQASEDAASLLAPRAGTEFNKQ